jgi:Tol biopolymer transport system component
MSKLVLLACVAAVALVATTFPAGATAPGVNGRIAFASDRSGPGTQNIYSIEPDRTGLIQLTFLTADQAGASEPSWSPDGKAIVFTEHSPDFSVWRLWLMNADGSNQHLLFGESGYNDFQGSFSPDGSRVIFRRCSNRREFCAIYSVKVDGRGLTALTHDVGTSKGENFDVKPEFSPDGNWISFSSFNRGGVQNGIYLMGVHGSKFQLITPTGLEAVDADWAPDSSRLVFWGPCCAAAPATIWSIRPDGTDLQQLTSSGAGFDIRPSYAPQGDAIAFERQHLDDFSLSDIYTIPAGGGTPSLLVSDAGWPSWGPSQ